MALSDKNIVITPNISASADPKIVFSGADASTAAQNITMTAYPTANGTLSFDGSAGQLFSITNSLSGTIFSVNDVSGIPSIEVLDTGTIKLAQYGGNVGIGNVPSGTYKLEVLGSISGNTITSTVATGSAPLVITSTTPVANLSIGGSAGSTTAAVTFTNTGGAAGGTTFNGSTARTIDYSTLGAAALAQIMYIGTTSVAINRSSADLALTGITSVTGTSTLTLNSTTTSALTIDSTTTGAINIGTNANAKTITLGNVTGATGLVVNTGTGGTTFNTLAAGFVKHAATVAPTVDMFQITNVGFPVVTAGVSSAQITFVGGSAAVEASANRVDITPGTLTGGTWNAYRVVSAAAATTGVTLNGIKFDSMTAGTGSDNALYVGTGWDNILNYNGTSVINGTGNLIAGQLTGQVSVSNGGTGSSSLTTNNVLLGNGTSALQVVAPGTSGNVLTSNGLTWISSTPASSSLPSQSGNGGKYLKTDGTTASWTDTLTAVKLSAYREVVVTVGTVSTSTYSINLSLGNVFDITLGINVTFTFTNPPAAGFLANCTIILRQNATGSKTATFTGSKYTDGVAPILSTGANQIDVLSFVTVDGGTSYFGSFVLANLF
jgi:hypothetical protein